MSTHTTPWPQQLNLTGEYVIDGMTASIMIDTTGPVYLTPEQARLIARQLHRHATAVDDVLAQGGAVVTGGAHQ